MIALKTFRSSLKNYFSLSFLEFFSECRSDYKHNFSKSNVNYTQSQESVKIYLNSWEHTKKLLWGYQSLSESSISSACLHKTHMSSTLSNEKN